MAEREIERHEARAATEQLTEAANARINESEPGERNESSPVEATEPKADRQEQSDGNNRQRDDYRPAAELLRDESREADTKLRDGEHQPPAHPPTGADASGRDAPTHIEDSDNLSSRDLNAIVEHHEQMGGQPRQTENFYWDYDEEQQACRPAFRNEDARIYDPDQKEGSTLVPISRPEESSPADAAPGSETNGVRESETPESSGCDSQPGSEVSPSQTESDRSSHVDREREKLLEAKEADRDRSNSPIEAADERNGNYHPAAELLRQEVDPAREPVRQADHGRSEWDARFEPQTTEAVFPDRQTAAHLQHGSLETLDRPAQPDADNKVNKNGREETVPPAVGMVAGEGEASCDPALIVSDRPDSKADLTDEPDSVLDRSIRAEDFPQLPEDGAKLWFHRDGCAWTTREGAVTVELAATPSDGRLGLEGYAPRAAELGVDFHQRTHLPSPETQGPSTPLDLHDTQIEQDLKDLAPLLERTPDDVTLFVRAETSFDGLRVNEVHCEVFASRPGDERRHTVYAASIDARGSVERETRHVADWGPQVDRYYATGEIPEGTHHLAETPDDDSTRVSRLANSDLELVATIPVEGPPLSAQFDRDERQSKDKDWSKQRDFGEQAMDQAMQQLGYSLVGYGAGTGIDGVYQNEMGEYVVAEAKFGSSDLANDQMSDDWAAPERLERAVGVEEAERIRAEGWGRYLVKTDYDHTTANVFDLGDVGR